MDNDLVENEHWLRRNWKWSIPAALVFIIITGLLLNPNSQESISATVQAYTDTVLYEKAITIANSDKRTLQTFGPIQPIDKLAILEGNASYSNHNTSVALTVRVSGTKKDGKLDITADKAGSQWYYKKIVIRNQRSKEEIVIVDELK